jgi:hypothetical protein
MMRKSEWMTLFLIFGVVLVVAFLLAMATTQLWDVPNVPN